MKRPRRLGDVVGGLNRTCACGAKFIASHPNHRHCSPECRRASASVERVCEQCGATFAAKQQHVNYKQKYCSPGCKDRAYHAKTVAAYPPREEVVRLYWDEGLSDQALGRHFGHSYQWAFKVRRHYSIPGHETNYKARKPLAKSRDRARWGIHLKPEMFCRNCGGPPGPKGLNLHHAVPRSMCKAAKYDLRNGLPLCAHCHGGWHGRSVSVYRDVFSVDEWAYVSALELAGDQPIGPWLDERYPERPAEPATTEPTWGETWPD